MSEHLSQLDIRAFRGLRNLRLEGLGSFNLFVGENNSGKTSILEAVLLALAPGDRENWDRIFAIRGESWDLPTRKARWLFPISESGHMAAPEAIELESSFGEDQEALRVRFGEVTQEKKTRKLKIGGREISEELVETENRLEIEWTGRNEGTKSGTIVYTDTTHSVRRHWGWNRSTEGPLERIPVRQMAFMAPRSHHNPAAVAESVSACARMGKKGDLLPFLQIFDPDITDLDVVTDQGHSDVLIQHRRLGSPPLHSFGDGMAKAVHVAATAFGVAGGALVLDEVETSLHYSAQIPFFKALRAMANQLDIQIFATTHSLDAVDGIISSMSDELGQLAAFHLPDRLSGHPMKRMDGDMLRRLRFERGFEIR